MFSMGDSVELHRIEDDKWIKLPKAHRLVYDIQGKKFRSCSFYVVPSRTERYCEYDCTDRVEQNLAHRYFGRGAVLEEGLVELPVGNWKFWMWSDGIRYRRDKTFEPGYEHPYKEPVKVERSNNAWRLPLPDGCKVNTSGYIGFVYPLPKLKLVSPRPLDVKRR